MSGVIDLSPDEVAQALARDEIHLVDVREDGEWHMARIPDAELVPMSRFDPSQFSVPEGKRVVLMCAGGMRSRSVAEALLDAGWDEVAHLNGGLKAWAMAGYSYDRS